MRWLAFLLVLVSCGGAQREHRIQSLDSLKTQVTQLQTRMDTLRKDSAQLAEISDNVTRWLVILPKVYQPDSINVDTALLLEQFANFNTVSPRFNIQYQRIKAEIPYTLKQLNSLQTDLQNKSLNNKDADKYTGVETAAAHRLMTAFEDLHATSQRTIRQYDSVHVPVIHLLDSLQHSTANLEAIRLKMLKAKTKKRK